MGDGGFGMGGMDGGLDMWYGEVGMEGVFGTGVFSIIEASFFGPTASCGGCLDLSCHGGGGGGFGGGVGWRGGDGDDG